MSLFKVETSKTIQTIEELNKTKKIRRKKIMTVSKYNRNELITEAIKIINKVIAAFTHDLEVDCVDIRLQLIDGHYEFHIGDSQYDVDHRGSWGYSCISTSESYQETEEDINIIAEELVDEALDDYYEFINEPSDFGLCGVYVDFD